MKTRVKVLSGLFLALLITVSAMGQDMKPDAGKLYNDGNQKLKAGNYTGAVESYDQALAIEKDYRIYSWLKLLKNGSLRMERNCWTSLLKKRCRLIRKS